MKKTVVGVLFGGRSTEHEISILSARNVIAALDPTKYDVVPIAIDKSNQWHIADVATLAACKEEAELICLSGQRNPHRFEVIFPVLHGSYGEDGTIQGLLKLAGIPFVGASVLGSAVGMDKEVMKRLLRDAKIPIARFIAATERTRGSLKPEALGLPCFVKPANTGSSVGISKVKQVADWNPAIDLALRYDRKVLIEEYIPGREIECAVLGNQEPIASLPGEVIPRHEFYSYEAKYLDPEGAHFKIPAELSPSQVAEVQKLAIEAYRTLCCEGMARVDFFLRSDGKLFVNEINTIPGFTSMSMYPKMWQASGIGYAELLDRLIALALERHAQEEKLVYEHVTAAH